MDVGTEGINDDAQLTQKFTQMRTWMSVDVDVGCGRGHDVSGRGMSALSCVGVCSCSTCT